MKFNYSINKRFNNIPSLEIAFRAYDCGNFIFMKHFLWYLDYCSAQQVAVTFLVVHETRIKINHPSSQIDHKSSSTNPISEQTSEKRSQQMIRRRKERESSLIEKCLFSVAYISSSSRFQLFTLHTLARRYQRFKGE